MIEYICTGYASENEVLKTIPYGYIDKTICGCGLTSVALENNEDVVIAVPRIELIDNKVGQYPNSRFKGNILGIQGGVTAQDIKSYIAKCKKSKMPVKIMSTYDSLPKCSFLLDKCHLIIDESDMLIRDHGINKVDIRNMLKLAEEHKDTTTFISATPLPLELMPDWVSTIPFVKISWTNTTTLPCFNFDRANPLKALDQEIIRPLIERGNVTISHVTFSKVLVFLNSINEAVKICKENDITNAGFICGDNLQNAARINQYGKRLNFTNTIGYTNMPQITFITSTGWTGVDIYDSACMSIVVSNSKKDYQIVDISTELMQATSRVRNNIFQYYIFIHNNAIPKLTEEDIKLHEEKIRRSIEHLNNIEDTLTKDSLEEFCEKAEEFRAYTYKENGKYVLDEMSFKADLFHCQKYSNMNNVTISSNLVGHIDIVKPIYIEDPHSFTYIKEHYFDKDIDKDCEMFQLIDACYKKTGKFWCNAYYTKKMLEAKSDLFEQIKGQITKSFKVGIWYSGAAEIKTKLQQMYDKVGLKRTAKATDLKEVGLSTMKARKDGKLGVKIIKL